MATEQTYSQSVTDEQVKAIVEARVKAAIDEGSKRPVQQIAEPAGWLNVWALGPFQVTGMPGPLLPHKVIRVGETFWVATVIWLNPTFPLPIPACTLITQLGAKFKLDYCTADMCAVKAVPQFSPHGIVIPTVLGQCYYTDVRQFAANSDDLVSCIYEMNICFQVYGCPNIPTSFAGWVTEVFDFDADVFYPPVPPTPPPPPTLPVPPGVPPTPFPGVGPGWRFNQPIRFMISAK